MYYSANWRQIRVSAEFAPNKKLIRIYKRVLIDFKLIWVIKRHYETLAYSIGDEELIVAPIDLNRIYGTLKVLYDMIQKSDSSAIVSRLEGAARDLVATLEWFKHLDEKISPYDLRFYLDHAVDIDSAQLRTFAKYFLRKQSPTYNDLAKADYLLARAFSWVNDEGAVHINVEDEEKLEAAITRILPRQWRRQKPAGYLAAAARMMDYILQLQSINSYDEMISSGLIPKARQFKIELGENFFSAQVLAKCVEFNVEARNRFERFCKEENDRLKAFSRALVHSGAELVQDDFDTREQVTLSSALEFSEQAQKLFSIDYSKTSPYLVRLSRMRDMLQRTVTLYGLDPHVGSPVLVDSIASSLKEHTMEELGYVDVPGLQGRISALSEMIRSTQSDIRARTSGVKLLHLENSTLVLSSWEFDAFKPAPQDGYFVRLSYDVLKRSVALVAEIQENLALYRIHQSLPQLANPYLMKVNFYVLQAQKIAEELEQLSESARERHEIDAACNLSATCQKVLDSYNRLKPFLENIK
jgi:hypothetical protein